MRDMILEKAKELGRLLITSSEHKRLEKARAEIEEHEAAKLMLRDLQEKQEKLRQEIMAGQDTATAQGELQHAYAVASYNPYVREYLEAEFSFAQLVIEVQEALGKALAPEDDEGQDPGEEEPRSRLWVPGRD
ncbi:MAG: YlbF family regulator [Limnochordia bacterium]|jgi:cell fate (sporulation/competence/biofilm development) regulator YlbF (YheA/YmcA/DUF963 family)